MAEAHVQRICERCGSEFKSPEWEDFCYDCHQAIRVAAFQSSPPGNLVKANREPVVIKMPIPLSGGGYGRGKGWGICW